MKLRIFASLERDWSVMRVSCLASLLRFVLPAREIKYFSDLPLCMEAYIFNDKNDHLFEITLFLLFE